MTHTQIREKISRSIHTNDPGAIAYLFGSRARGDFRPDSDWDILILVDNPEFSNSIDELFRDELYNIEIDTGQIISSLVYPKEYWKNTLQYSPLYKKILTEGILL